MDADSREDPSNYVPPEPQLQPEQQVPLLPSQDTYAEIVDWGDRVLHKSGHPDTHDVVGNAVNRVLGIERGEVNREGK